MPIFEHRCTKCFEVKEDLYKGDCPETVTCPKCGSEAKRKMSLYARTPGLFGDCGLGGTAVNGVYDRGLGASYQNSRERDRLIAERGVIPLSDLGSYAIEDNLEKRKYEARAADAYNDTFDKTMAETNSIYTAHEKAMSAKETA